MKGLTFSGVVIASVVATLAAAVYAFVDRGYFAFGGEYFFLMLPLIAYTLGIGVEEVGEVAE